MNTKQMIETFRTQAANDKVFDNTMHMFASRERTRYMIMVTALEQRMKAAGFEHTRDEYVKVIKFLGEHGVGKLVHDSRGRILGLKEITVRLQSIGVAVLHEAGKVEPFRPRTKYYSVKKQPKRIDLKLPSEEVKVTDVGWVRPLKTVISSPMVLTFLINGKPVNVSIPEELETTDITDLVRRLQSASA